MKYLKQFLIIIAISFAGELIKALIPLPIPASIYGMILMFALLESGVLKVSKIKETSAFLVEIMPIMFVPAGVGLMSSVDVLKPIWLQVVIITILSTFIVMGVTGLITQAIIRKGGKKA